MKMTGRMRVWFLTEKGQVETIYLTCFDPDEWLDIGVKDDAMRQLVPPHRILQVDMLEIE